jgi:hypothetical protein
MLAGGIFLFLSVANSIQAQAFREGNLLVSAGYGFGNSGASFFSDLNDLDNYKLRPLGPFLLKAETAVSDKVGLGINIAYLNSVATFNYRALDDNAEEHTYEARVGTNAYSILGRVNFHLGKSDDMDFYLGFGAGYRGRFTNTSDDQPTGDYGFTINNNLTNVGFETTVGLRYYVKPRLGLFFEGGFAKAPLQLGLSYKFGSSGSADPAPATP